MIAGSSVPAETFNAMLFPDERDDFDAVRGMLLWTIVCATFWLALLL